MRLGKKRNEGMKMKAMQEITMEMKTESEVKSNLVEFSKLGGAWVISILPFSRTVSFRKYKNPSSVPDYMRSLSRVGPVGDHLMAWKGVLRDFTKAAIIREQNRGLGCE
jgi:hypothetical protein